MRVVRTVEEMRRIRPSLDGPVSMMATLGGIHAGHEALLTRGRQMGASLVASLFLNPTQFNDPSDLESYPHDTERDIEVFEAHGVDVVFAPAVEEMHPEGGATTVDPGWIGGVLEGARRPGHLKAVATVVTKILQAIRPDVAVWGAKDAQQNAVIRGLSRDLFMGVEHVIVPTVRAEDGLALSSRNSRLSPTERAEATGLFRALEHTRERFADGESSSVALISETHRFLSARPHTRVDYVAIVDPDSFREVHVAESGAVVLVAAFVGQVRLIDNVVLA